MKQNIKALRRLAKLSGSEAAALIGGCHLRTWRLWEANGKMPLVKYHDLELYARLYKAMIAEFKMTKTA